jgi:hypothetical protein
MPALDMHPVLVAINYQPILSAGGAVVGPTAWNGQMYPCIPRNPVSPAPPPPIPPVAGRNAQIHVPYRFFGVFRDVATLCGHGLMVGAGNLVSRIPARELGEVMLKGCRTRGSASIDALGVRGNTLPKVVAFARSGAISVGCRRCADRWLTLNNDALGSRFLRATSQWRGRWDISTLRGGYSAPRRTR